MADTNPVVTALDAYVENAQFPLVGALQFNPNMTAAEVTVQSGIKGSSKLHYLETDVNFLAGTNCDRATPTDTTTFTDKTITVADIDAAENMCLELLVGKYTQIYLKKGATLGKQEIPSEIARIYWEQKMLKMSQALDTADWQGDTASLTNNLKRYDGWIKWIDAGSAVIGNTGGVTSLTTSNIVAVFQAMVLAIPTHIQQKSNLTLYAPIEIVRMYGIALTNANLFHFKGDGLENTFIHGTDIRIRPTYGLNGTNRMFITYPENLVLGVDGENDTEFTSRLDPTSLKRIFIDASFRRGTQVSFVEDVVSFDLTVS